VACRLLVIAGVAHAPRFHITALLATRARELGITVSLGHQMAGRSQLAALAAAGATLVTHLGNGMPNMVHRHDNIIFAAAAKSVATASNAHGRSRCIGESGTKAVFATWAGATHADYKAQKAPHTLYWLAYSYGAHTLCFLLCGGSDDLCATIITDGFHLPPDVIKVPLLGPPPPPNLTHALTQLWTKGDYDAHAIII